MSNEFALWLARDVVRVAARYLIRELDEEQGDTAYVAGQIRGIERMCELIGVPKERLRD